MKKKSLLYWIFHVLLLVLMAGSGIYYLVDFASVAEIYLQLQYPEYSIYANAIAKILGGMVIIMPQFSRWLKEWAYAGYLYIMILATQSIVMTMPGFPWVMVVSFAIWAGAYWQFRKQVA